MTDLRCRLGLHARMPVSHSNPFINDRYGCRRCPARWALVIIADRDCSWVRLADHRREVDGDG